MMNQPPDGMEYPDTDAHGLMTNLQQLRFLAHALALNLRSLLQLTPTLSFTDPVLYAALLEMTQLAHDYTCEDRADRDNPFDTPDGPVSPVSADDPLRRLFENWDGDLHDNLD